MVTSDQDRTLLAARGLVFAYPGGSPLIRGVSVALGSGELVGLAGPNGSGKTTLLRLLTARLKPAAGSVILAGQPLKCLSRPQIARLVGVVAQDGAPALPFSALEVVLMGRAARLRGIFETEGDLRVARKAMELTETDHLGRRPFGQLSAGERQRVLIARALAQEPRLLLLDEPAAFLDLRHQVAVCELIGRLAAEHGLAVLAVTHDLNLAARFCHRLMLLSEGRLIASGPCAEVLSPENLEAAFGIRVRVERDCATGALRMNPARNCRA